MAWTTLPTYVSGNALTAAQVNAIAANINETAVAKASAEGEYFVATGANALTPRTIESASVTTTSTTTSTSYTSNPSGDDGPEVTGVSSGTNVIVWQSAQLESNGTGSVWVSFSISGATTSAASDTRAIMQQNGASNGARCGVITYLTVTAGSNDYLTEFRVSGNTGSFDDRWLTVMPL